MSLPTPVCLTTQSTPVTRAASPGFFGEGATYGAGNHHSPRLLHEDERSALTCLLHVLPGGTASGDICAHTLVASSTVSAPQGERRSARTRCPCAIDG